MARHWPNITKYALKFKTNKKALKVPKFYIKTYHLVKPPSPFGLSPLFKRILTLNHTLSIWLQVEFTSDFFKTSVCAHYSQTIFKTNKINIYLNKLLRNFFLKFCGLCNFLYV